MSYVPCDDRAVRELFSADMSENAALPVAVSHAAVIEKCIAAIGILFIAFLPAAACADTAGLVRGSVTVDGKLTGGIVVRLQGRRIVQTTTDDAGAFVFPRIVFGSYTISAATKDTAAAQTKLDVSSDAVVTVSLTLSHLHEIGRTSAAVTTGASGTPVSVNTLDRTQIAALPAFDSLNALIQTVPGVVPFSYGETVAHGFHGLTYEIDGVPLPQGSTSNFAEVVDPRDIDSLEVFTGAIPAEFGGNRIGAVVNVVTDRAADLNVPSQGSVEFGAGSYGAKEGTVEESFKLGASRLFVSGTMERTDRGLDTPTFVPDHDNANQGDEFVRFITPVGKRGTLAADISNRQSVFQIPTNAAFNMNDPVRNAPGTDDTQLEYKRFANIAFTENTPDQRGYYQIVPWVSYDRVAYNGDLSNDVLGTFYDTSGSQCVLATQEPNCPLDGLREDRRSDFGGLRANYFHEGGRHALKFGLDGNYEDFSGASVIAQAGQPNFTDDASKRGTQFAAYGQDKWELSKIVTMTLGLRYDRSDGFTSGDQLSPRAEVNVAPDGRNVVHFYYGRFYAAPFLEDTRCAAIVAQDPGTNCSNATVPAYDLQPEHDTYYEGGVAHTFKPGLTGYFNYWERNVADVLDTTQIFPTPIFAVYNNTIGRAEGAEVHLKDVLSGGDAWYFSGTASNSSACGISGGTFLFPPDQISCLPQGLQPEDHDQTYTVNSAYTHRFAADKRAYATLQALYGSGYPVQFQNGEGRLTPHLTFNASLGRDPGRNGSKSLGYRLDIENGLGDAYLLKINNGFNTTQWAPGFKATFRITAPI
jgi:outer membrane receptor protein involved in Fe transport